MGLVVQQCCFQWITLLLPLLQRCLTLNTSIIQPVQQSRKCAEGRRKEGWYCWSTNNSTSEQAVNHNCNGYLRVLCSRRQLEEIAKDYPQKYISSGEADKIELVCCSAVCHWGRCVCVCLCAWLNSKLNTLQQHLSGNLSAASPLMRVLCVSVCRLLYIHTCACVYGPTD